MMRGDGLLLRHRELLAPPRRPAAAAPRPTPARLLPRGLPARHRRVARRRCRRSAACTKATCRASATLVDHGFRLPSAMDNRPLSFEEFLDRIGQTIYLSAPRRATTSSPRSAARQRGRADHPADRPGRPRGDRQADQGPDRRPDRTRSGERAERNERVLVTTLTKTHGRGPHRLPARGRHPGPLPAQRDRHAASGSRCSASCGIGEFDVLVGINLLREGLDLPGGVAGGDPRRRQGGLPALRRRR